MGLCYNPPFIWEHCWLANQIPILNSIFPISASKIKYEKSILIHMVAKGSHKTPSWPIMHMEILDWRLPGKAFLFLVKVVISNGFIHLLLSPFFMFSLRIWSLKLRESYCNLKMLSLRARQSSRWDHRSGTIKALEFTIFSNWLMFATNYLYLCVHVDSNC